MYFLEPLLRYPLDAINSGGSSIVKSRQWTKFFYHLQNGQLRMSFFCYRNSHIQCFF